MDPVSGGLAPVITPSTNYEQQPDGSYRQGPEYTRADNPTYEHAERLLAALEGAGCGCALFASGMAAVCALAHSAGVRVAADNTVATPVLTRPFEHGADLVVHSATKYLNGHSDVLAGAVLSARHDPFWERIRSWRRNAGAVPGPFEAWLLQRGMRTLFLRVDRASQTALAIATHFHTHPALTAVLYPGLPSHPGHQIAARQMTGGFGGMLSIRLAGGAEQATAVLRAVRVFKRATSLGGVESLIEHRRTTEGPSSPVPDDLLRLSVGIEAAGDLIADLEAALEAARRIRPGASTAAPEQAAG